MNVTMDDSRLINVTQLQEFLTASQKVIVSLENSSLEEKYQFIQKTIKQFSYWKLSRKEKHIVIMYIKKVTGYKKRQLYRLVNMAEKGKLKKAVYVRTSPTKIYVTKDIKRLEETDELHLRLSEGATKEIMRREFEVFGHREYQTAGKLWQTRLNSGRFGKSERCVPY